LPARCGTRVARSASTNVVRGCCWHNTTAAFVVNRWPGGAGRRL
jgi:hypothetical protein